MEKYLYELFDRDQLFVFWPSPEYKRRDNTMAALRFIVYSSIILYILTRDWRIMWICMLIVFGAIILSPLYDVHGYSPNPYNNRMPTDTGPLPAPDPATVQEYLNEASPFGVVPVAQSDVNPPPVSNQRVYARQFVHIPERDTTALTNSLYPYLVDKNSQCRDDPKNCSPDVRYERLQQR